MLNRLHAFTLAMIPLCAVEAQVSLTTTVPDYVQPLSTLVNAGPKLISSSVTGFTLREPDGTPFLAVTYPALPPGMQFPDYSPPFYITESLFDQDPATIEYLQGFQTTSGAGTLVARTDGTVLLLDTSHYIGVNNGFDAFSSKSPIFNTPTGTLMVLVKYGIDSRIYSLAGELPCLDCSFNSATGGGAEFAPPVPSLAVYPTISGTSVMIDHSAFMQQRPTRLVVMDASGRSVASLTPDPSGRLSFDVSSLAAGTYTYVLENAGGRLGTARQVVGR